MHEAKGQRGYLMNYLCSGQYGVYKGNEYELCNGNVNKSQ